MIILFKLNVATSLIWLNCFLSTSTLYTDCKADDNALNHGSIADRLTCLRISKLSYLKQLINFFLASSLFFTVHCALHSMVHTMVDSLLLSSHSTIVSIELF